MKFRLFIIVLLISFKISAQNPLGLEYQRSFESVLLDDYEDYFFSNSSFLFTKAIRAHRLAYGLEIQEALRGEFGGLYVFGLCGEYDYKLPCLPLSVNLNTFIGGGGGAGAPDGSGLAYRYALGLKAHLTSNFNLFTRYSNYDFPTGSIGGKQVQLGFSYGLPSVFNTKLKDSNVLQQSFSLQGLLMKLDKADSGRLNNVYLSKLISVEYAFEFKPRFQGLVRLQAAMSDKVDGYMAYYSGISYSLIKSSKFSWNICSLLGSSGGGDMRTQGGLGMLMETGLSYTAGNKTLRVSRGMNSSLEGDFSAYYTQLGVKFNFESTALLGAKGNTIVIEDGYKLSRIGVESGVELHLAPKGGDYGGLQYEDMALMSFGIRCPFKSKYELLGQTRWAFGGNYGAYAEGIVGLSRIIFKKNKFNIQLPVQIIVAGGGGIDVGKGVGLQINLEGNYALSNTTYISATVAKMNMFMGNYDPLSFNIGLKQDLYFYMK